MQIGRVWLLASVVILSITPGLRTHAQEQSPVFRSGVQLVELTVTVRDKANQPVFGLQASDFVLFEDGNQRRIDVFAAPMSPETRADAQNRLPPGVYSNVPEVNRDSRGIVIVLLDSINTCVGNQMRAKSQVVEFLRALPPDQRLALFSVGRSFRVLHDFTADPESLIQRLQSANSISVDPTLSAAAEGTEATGDSGGFGTAGSAGTGIALADPQVQQWISDGQTLGNQFQYVRRIRTSVQTLREIARNVERYPGKKTLLWLSGGFPQLIGPAFSSARGGGAIGQENVSKEVTEAIAAANRAGLAIYAVDSRGLMPGDNFGPDLCDGMNPTNTSGNHGVMQEVALRTGGRAILNDNALPIAMREAFDEVAAAYTLGIYVPEERRDGRAHRLEVKLPRKDLSLAHRKNYILDRPTTNVKPVDTLMEAANSPVDDVGLLFLATIHAPQTVGAKPILQMVLQPGQVVFTEKDGDSTTSLRLVLVPRLPDGKSLKGISDTIHVNLRAEQRQHVDRAGLVLTRELDAYPGATQLRVVLQDPAYGLMGSLTIPLAK